MAVSCVVRLKRHVASLVAAFLKPSDTVIATFTEVESGRNSERAQLGAAIRAARLHRATLLIAKHEAAMTSSRTKAALAAAKARGVALGGWKALPWLPRRRNEPLH